MVGAHLHPGYVTAGKGCQLIGLVVILSPHVIALPLAPTVDNAPLEAQVLGKPFDGETLGAEKLGTLDNNART